MGDLYREPRSDLIHQGVQHDKAGQALREMEPNTDKPCAARLELRDHANSFLEEGLRSTGRI